MKDATLASCLLAAVLAGPAAAQTALLEITDPAAAAIMRVNDDAGLVAHGTLDVGAIPAVGTGVRFMWYPGKAAIRAGGVTGHWDDEHVGRWSAAFGENVTANADHSLAIGINTVASGTAGVALGRMTGATGSASTAFGASTLASGDGSTASGFSTLASADAATAMGNQTKATGNDATAMGQKTTASGVASTALGGSTTATGAASLAAGRNSVASGNVSTAFGAETQANGQFSTAMGRNAEARAEGSFAFGDASTTMVVAVVPNQFVARASGGFRFLTNPNLTTGCDIDGGNLVCTGTVSGSSSAALKHDFEPVDADSILERVAGLRIQRWRYRADTADIRHIGPTAEDFRHAFGLGADGRTIAMVDADGVGLLAVQALVERLAELRREVAGLRDEFDRMKSRLQTSR